MQFNELGLSQAVLSALTAKGYTVPTPIQSQAIPPLLEGKDLLGIAQTGTGKTLAFVAPSIDRLVASKQRPQPRGCRMLVLAPTRELAAQIAESAKAYSKGTGLTVATVFGGTSVHKNKVDLARGVDILVATPGRLVDLMDQHYLILLGIEIFVLDEADQMMDLGFIHALKRIVRDLPSKRQSLFFSATMPKTIRDLAGQFLKSDPVEVKVTPVATTAERVTQSVTFVQQAEKQALLTILLRDPSIDRALIFTRTKHGADRVVKLLAGNGVASNAIHGNKSQPQRERALGEFKAGKVKILIATDIAARGIDVSGVSHVFNFELPNVPEQYVHRIGRTARAGADGIAVSFCAPDEKPYLKDIEKLTRQKIEIVALPEDFINESNKIKSTRSPMVMSRDEANGRNGRAMQGQRPGAGRGQPPRKRPAQFEARPANERRDGAQGGRSRPEGQGQNRGPAQGQRGDQPRRAEGGRNDWSRLDGPRADTRHEGPRQGEQRRNDAPRADRPQGEKPQRDYARKSKWQGRPTQGGGHRNNAGRSR
ncbi:DEAD/DEAH box helicase [Sphingomonas sp. G-3-2-10]|uniref:DEAD/DEAH box helicase n=1 Tax=Sphingomonas sp. G-3-2-10 TaxID=2728838 RepID=UPI00146CCB7B|nr:DEAD/DEAH box helicase [Sphingomonas sp. G-3-2-10]NML07483.1 DEAD/DEAH box helicase [Sphingomonas sp. G-3-2-10]